MRAPCRPAERSGAQQTGLVWGVGLSCPRGTSGNGFGAGVGARMGPEPQIPRRGIQVRCWCVAEPREGKWCV